MKFKLLRRTTILVLAVSFFLLHTSTVLAQKTNMIKGLVESNDGKPVSGVSVLIKNTRSNFAEGTSTDSSGVFSFSRVPSGNDFSFTFSRVGYKTQVLSGYKIDEGTSLSLVVKLIDTMELLTQVTVTTALGIKRQARSLGYSTATVNMSDLSSSSQSSNLGGALVGKVAGVNVSPLSSGPGGSSKIRIRGQSSFGGNNSPLIIVNGSPINNESSKTRKGADAGDGLLSINESDIETMTVLKGAAAAALYGYRAKDGAIIITTKSASRGTGIEYNVKFRVDDPLDYTDFQYVYGEGINNLRPKTTAEALSSGTWSFGEKMDGAPTIQFDGTTQPYSPNKDRVKTFYRPGTSLTNSLAVSGGNEKGGFRISFTNIDANAIVENSNFKNKILNLSVNYKLTSKLSVNSNINYSHEDSHNPVKISGATGINETAYSAAVSIPTVVLKNYLAADGTELHYSRFASKTNPFWIINKQFENQTRDRLLGNVRARYDFTDDLYFQAGVSQDYFNSPYENNTPTGTATLGVASIGYNGNYIQAVSTFRELNIDFLAGIKHTFGAIGISLAAGGNQMDQKNTSSATSATNFYNKDLYTIGNGQVLSPSYNFREKKVNSLYGSADFAYRNLLFLTLTARNDWFSTLNTASDSYLYPSASTSFIFTDALKSKPKWLNYGKFRVAYAEVGGDTDPYQSSNYYSINTSTLNGVALGSFASGVSPNSNLKPLKVKETEVGMEIRTFNSRLNLDFAVYNKNTVDEILNVDISNASGYNQTKVNIGRLRNRGVEALLTIVPIKSKVTWETGFNGAYNISKVLKLANGQLRLDVGNPTNLGTLSHEVGYPLASIRVFDYKRDAQGRIIVSNGLPLQGNKITVGSAIPKWTGSWINTITVKGFRIFTQVDFKAGAKMLSATNYNEMRFGMTKGSLLGREGGIILDAVNADGSKNTTTVTSYNYFTNFSDGLIGTPNIFNASFVKWRTLSVGYDLSKYVNKTFIKNMSVNLYCNNVLMIKKYLDNMDPEAMAEASDNLTGMEVYALPTSRSFGVNLNVKF